MAKFTSNDQKLKDALHHYVSSLAKNLPQSEELEDIEFSEKLQNNMSKLLRRQRQVYYYWTNTVIKKVACVVVILGIMTSAVTFGVGALREPHTFTQATCTKPKICTHCQMEAGEPLGHQWKPATCTEKKICTVCGAKSGKALGHNFETVVEQYATCEDAGYVLARCSRCKLDQVTEPEALGHDWQEATCQAPKTCKRCSATVGEKTDHKYELDDNYYKCIYCGLDKPLGPPPKFNPSNPFPEGYWKSFDDMFGKKGSPKVELPEIRIFD